MIEISKSQNSSGLLKNFTILKGCILRIDVGQNWIRKYSLKRKSAILLCTTSYQVWRSTTNSNDSISVLSKQGGRET